MKTSRSNPSKQNSQGASKKPRPEIRDDLDSRKEKVKSKDKVAKLKDTEVEDGKTGKGKEVKTKKPVKKKAKK